MLTQPFHGNVSFNAHHSPMGAYFTFTCGHIGTRGGLAAQLGKPGNQDLYIGVKLGGRYDPAPVKCLPFFDGARSRMQDGAQAYTLEKPTGETDSLAAYHPRDIRRHYAWSTDTWKAGDRGNEDFEFSIYTPFASIPEPARASNSEMRAALLPAVTAELIIDNRRGTTTKTGFFAINFNEGGARIIDEGLSKGRVGFALRSHYGVAAEAVEVLRDGTRRGSDESGIAPFPIMRWSVQQGLEDKSNPVHLLGSVPGIAVEVPAGKMVILRVALGCYLDGIVTTRLEGRYLYTRYFTSLLDVLNEALTYVRFVKVDCNTLDDRLLLSKLNRDQQFLIAHATRSYYGNTQLLEIAGQPWWIVNEGEYCMINTLDLSVDQMFWELDHNPWVVRNLLDQFVRYYSYQDQVKDKNDNVSSGGLSFTHDQGAHNQFAPFGTSSYELRDLTGCFSFMTQEQLCNWILIAACYVTKTNDLDWLEKNRGVLNACAESMVHRIAGSPHGQNTAGIMTLDSTRCGIGAEITTYDSLDASLGQARQSLYIAIKCWASYLGLRLMSGNLSERLDIYMRSKALQIQEVLEPWIKDGIMPALFDGNAQDAPQRILPAIEALVYPCFWGRVANNTEIESDIWEGPEDHEEKSSAILTDRRRANLWLSSDGPFKDLISGLRTHTIKLLSDPDRRNHFPDGGIRLSSTSDNSWLSKIAIVQHVARSLFNLNERGEERKYKGDAHGWEKADAAHVKWLTEGESAYWAASDQIISGVAKGSKYYPRLITTALWLNE